MDQRRCLASRLGIDGSQVFTLPFVCVVSSYYSVSTQKYYFACFTLSAWTCWPANPIRLDWAWGGVWAYHTAVMGSSLNVIQGSLFSYPLILFHPGVVSLGSRNQNLIQVVLVTYPIGYSNLEWRFTLTLFELWLCRSLIRAFPFRKDVISHFVSYCEWNRFSSLVYWAAESGIICPYLWARTVQLLQWPSSLSSDFR